MENLQRIKIEIENHSVREIFWKLNSEGKITGEKHFGRVIGPEDDISAEPEDVQAHCQIARIGYVKQTIETEE